MKNITIAKRLIFLICIALASLIIIALGAAYELRSSQQRFEKVQTTVIPSIVLLSEANANAAAIRAAVRDYIIGGFFNNPVMIKQQVDLLDNFKVKITSQLDLYEKSLISNDEDKALLNEDRKALDAYLVEVNDVFEKVNHKDLAGLSQQFSLDGKFRKTAGHLIKSFSDHAVFNQKLADESNKAGAEEFRKGMTFLSTVVLLVFVALGALGGFLIRGIRTPLLQMQSVMDIIKNDLDFRVRANNDRSDEIGYTSRALDDVLGKLQSSLSSISGSAKAVGERASQMAITSGEVATASHQQSEAASNMAATVEEMTVSINHVGDRARDADNIAVESGNLAKAGEEVIAQTVKEINDISTTVDSASDKIRQLVENSQRISTVVGVIRDVADQTNLLALNAAIEAARAGEQGRGFAVVADEVRKLAERTAASTQEIAETIESMRVGAADVADSMEKVVVEVSEGVESIQQASDVIRNIGDGSRRTVEVVDEITSAIREQATAMTSIAQQVEHIAQMSEESSAAAQNSAQVATDLDCLAIEMGKTVSAYKL